jgi:hypothetical protein
MGERQAVRLVLAACAVFGLTASACNRTALVALPEDAAPPDSTRDRAAEPAPETVREDVREDVVFEAGKEQGPERGPEAGPEAPLDLPSERRPEAGPEARPEVGADVREAGPELRYELVVEVGTEAGPEAGPEARRDLREAGAETGDSRDGLAETTSRDARPGCTWPTTTSTLAELGWPAVSSALAVRGDNVFVGISQISLDTTPPASAIVGIAISTGKTTTFPVGNFLPSWLTAGSDSLFYLQGKATSMGGGSWRFDYPDVARLDLATGKISVVDSEIVPLGYSILSLADNPRGEVFWSMLASAADSSSVVKQWDQASSSVKKVKTVDQPATILADDDHLYWSGLNSASQMAFFSMSTTGGKVTQIQEWSDTTDAQMLRAVDEQSLYFVRPSTPTKGIFAMPKAGGDSRTVVANADPIAFGSKNVDDTHVYWVDYADQATIQRAPKSGNGAVEKIPSEDFGGVSDVAVDRCNIYWLPSGKPRVLVRGK